ncbi:MptD family putative ECF transporter S component [Dermabacteraceae bacterium TAE3-ERU27]|nr:MptD family putative ECF transporter S component [Dermabacteraceae bacterium TAE3-ERU27]
MPTQNQSVFQPIKAKDLINVAVFAAIFNALTFSLGVLGAINPVVWLLITIVIVFINGTTFMLFMSRVNKAGLVTLFGTSYALIYLLMGAPLQSSLLVIFWSIMADIVAGIGRYRSEKFAIASYCTFGLAIFSWFAPAILNPEAFFTGSQWDGLRADYVVDARALLSAPVVCGFCVTIILAALFGAMLGLKYTHKHFRKAGLA